MRIDDVKVGEAYQMKYDGKVTVLEIVKAPERSSYGRSTREVRMVRGQVERRVYDAERDEMTDKWEAHEVTIPARELVRTWAAYEQAERHARERHARVQREQEAATEARAVLRPVLEATLGVRIAPRQYGTTIDLKLTAAEANTLAALLSAAAQIVDDTSLDVQ